MAESSTPTQKQPRNSKRKHDKLPRLPNNAKITKRPLLRPAIPSSYSGAQNQKTVYISAKTPFLAAVKRVEKLLHLADKRLVQSATTLAKAGNGPARGKRKRGAEEDEILDIAETVEQLKQKGRKDGRTEGEVVKDGEDVVLRATGKAIQKCLELGLWFQQREEYTVRLVTGSVGAIDDIAVEEDLGGAIEDVGGKCETQEQSAMDTGDDAAAGADDDPGVQTEVDQYQTSNDPSKTTEKQPSGNEQVGSSHVDVPESRIRYTSSLEVYVSLR